MKRIVVTGATSGIGEEIAYQLGRAGAALVLGCRDVDKGERVAARIRAEGGTDDVVVLPLDAASQQSIQDFSRAYRERFDRLDVLVNNAGLGHGQRLETPEGLELVFATNVLGYHRLSLALSDLLVRSAPARIVVVASTFASNLDLDDLQWVRRPYEELAAYAQSKACNRLFSWALARRLETSGVTVNAMAPGFRARHALVAKPVARPARRLQPSHRPFGGARRRHGRVAGAEPGGRGSDRPLLLRSRRAAVRVSRQRPRGAALGHLPGLHRLKALRR